MRYATARYNEKRRELAYRIYVSDCLRIITENTAKFSGGSYMKGSLLDALSPKPKDDRSPEEMVAEIITKAGITVI